MSTEADIVVELEQQARNRTVNLGASDAWKYSVEYRAIQEITKLRAERDAAARALRPFADAAGDLDEKADYSDHIWESPAAMSITAGDLHEALNVLSMLPQSAAAADPVIATEDDNG